MTLNNKNTQLMLFLIILSILAGFSSQIIRLKHYNIDNHHGNNLGIASTTNTWKQNGIVISAKSQSETDPMILSDEAGGAFITWVVANSPTAYDIYAQKINFDGELQWSLDGVEISTAPSHQHRQQLVSDGAGGAIIAWEDWRTDIYNNDIYAQRINSLGEIQWTVDGVFICNGEEPQLVSDMNGGAIIIWENWEDEGNIYAQKINSTGDIQWTTSGALVFNRTEYIHDLKVVTDDLGGAIVVWEQGEINTESYDPIYDIFAQRINSSGHVKWDLDAIKVCNATGSQFYPELVTDGSGGIVVIWEDWRNELENGGDIYVQRINSSGDILWTDNGACICDAQGDQKLPRMTKSNDGEFIVAWTDVRSTTGDIYSQRFNSSGHIQWDLNGVCVCSASDNQNDARITSNGKGGAYITWLDGRNGNTDIYTQNISSSGKIQWGKNGGPLCSAGGSQYKHQLVDTGNGSAISVWVDNRGGYGVYDIYSQKIPCGFPSTDAIPGFKLTTISLVTVISVALIGVVIIKTKCLHEE